MIDRNKLIFNISKKMNLKQEQINNTLKLIEQNNTIPFIARYRKEVTDGLNEEQIFYIKNEYDYQLSLEEKKLWTIEAINKKGKLTEEIIKQINACEKLTQLDNIYKPYIEKRKTRAAIAIKLGFKPLANYILSLPKKSIVDEVNKYVTNEINYQQVIQYVQDIIAEIISDDLSCREIVKNSILNFGYIVTKPKNIELDTNKKYTLYYETKLKIKNLLSYKIMALNRAEKEKVISLKFDFDIKFSNQQIVWKYTKNYKSEASSVIENAINDGMKRLLIPSVENEIWSELLENAQDHSIEVFKTNLEYILCQAPIKEKNILGIDPAFRTGCKLAMIDKNNNVLKIDTIFPVEPHNKIIESENILNEFLKEFNVDIIAIGNGTASRETELFISNWKKKYKLDIKHVIVNESGASVYSASELARKEFPDLSVEKRSAISIARRVIDPLSELIKIDPKSIGVGQYQHDVPEKKLDYNLSFVINKIVNRVGVDVNTASDVLLKYISGINEKIAKAIIQYRQNNKKIKSREELKNISLVTNKVFEQSSGFLRIKDGYELLDETSIHPDNYSVAKKIINDYKIDLNNSSTYKNLIGIDLNLICDKYNLDKYNAEQIIQSIIQKRRDYRDEFDAPILKQDVLSFEDLKLEMQINGVVRNVLDFGAFIDIGIKDDGFLHISSMELENNQSQYDKFHIGQILNVKIKKLDNNTKRVELKL